MKKSKIEKLIIPQSMKDESPNFHNYGVYFNDLPLYKKLKLNSEPIQHGVLTLLGTVNIGETGKLKISCYAVPSHFFTFELTFRKNKCLVFSTGSGSLTTYWQILEPLLKEIERDMIVINTENGE